MLAPVNTSVLERNPRFAHLYQEMVQSRLNPDMTTKVIKQQRVAVEIEKSLNEHKTESARRELIESALEQVALDSVLPMELARAGQITLAVRNGQLSSADVEVLKDDLELFQANSHIVAAAISTQLQNTATILSAFLPSSPTTVPAGNPDQTATATMTNLSSQTSELTSSIPTQAALISATRSRIAELATQVSLAHTDVLESAIRILEQTMHGSVARGLKARAEHLSVVAKGLDLKVRILAANDPLLAGGGHGHVDGDAAAAELLVDAVSQYDTQLDGTIEGLERQLQALQAEVDGYVGAGRGMEQIADRYAVLVKRKGELKDELDRLRK